MKQLSLIKILWYHLYPGLLLTAFFAGLTPFLAPIGIPSQMVLLLGIPTIILPVMYVHLKNSKKKENKESIIDLIPYRNELPRLKLISITIGLVVFAFLMYGITQPLNEIITKKMLFWIPEIYQIQNFQGYSEDILIITLLLNLILNGLVAPLIEEIYFRGYLLPRMSAMGKYAPLASTLLFSVYHFWQPQIYLTLILSLLPMIYLTWRLKSIKLAIYTHCGLNLVGALLSFGLLYQ